MDSYIRICRTQLKISPSVKTRLLTSLRIIAAVELPFFFNKYANIFTDVNFFSEYTWYLKWSIFTSSPKHPVGIPASTTWPHHGHSPFWLLHVSFQGQWKVQLFQEACPRHSCPGQWLLPVRSGSSYCLALLSYLFLIFFTHFLIVLSPSSFQ